MERDCKKCIHHIGGSCDAWECQMQTLEDYRAKAIDEFAEVLKEKWIEVDDLSISYEFFEFVEEISEELKGGAE